MQLFAGLFGIVLLSLAAFYCIVMILLPIFVYQIAQRTKKTEEYLGRILSIVALEASGRNRKPAQPPLKQHKKIKSDGFISG